MRVGHVALVAASALTLSLTLFARGAESAEGVRFGIQDDAWLEFGPGTLWTAPPSCAASASTSYA